LKNWTSIKRKMRKEKDGMYEIRRDNQTAPFLFLLNTLEIGGSEWKIVRIINELRRRGRNVHIAYLNRPETLLQEVSPGTPVICLHRAGKISLRAFGRLRNYVTSREISRIICVNLYPMLYAMPVMYFGGRQTMSCAVLVNTTEYLSVKETYQMLLYSRLLRRANKVVFGCQTQLEQWVRTHRLARSKCQYIYNGVDEDWFSMPVVRAEIDKLRKGTGLDMDHFVVGNVGQLTPKKQHKDFIRAIGQLAEDGIKVRGVIVGEGPERPELERFLKERNLGDRVLLLGEMADARPALAMIDVFVLTSAGETFSNAALEAMSMGKPVILSDVGGAREMVCNGQNGYLYEKGNVSELVLLVKKLLQNSETRQRVGENARRTVMEKFSFVRMVDQYEKLISEV